MPDQKSSYPKTSQPKRWLNIEELRREHAKAKTIYESNFFAKKVRMLMHARPWKFINAIALGLGSFSWFDENVSHPDQCLRSLYQVIVFKDMVDCLAEARHSTAFKDPGIKLYAQDPAFNELDKVFLESLGIEMIVVENQGRIDAEIVPFDDKGRKLIGPRTFLLCHGYVATRAMVDGNPELIIGQIMEGHIQRLSWSEESLETMGIDLDDYDEDVKERIEQHRRYGLALDKIRKERNVVTLLDPKENFARYFGTLGTGIPLNAYCRKLADC
ncbi:hypothetical protein EJ08DRAFT_63827 [Tothia fuscella]|uniref:SRR1-like domain-containing protein n=1 Tax=Tothia fuscella TaxID=1048955 RepID=A0A9P4NF00_9PEZI|nr:hypothetical protein EJ08DRAFT_63827 [Tothia fuscella]